MVGWATSFLVNFWVIFGEDDGDVETNLSSVGDFGN
jgi:hypothetical protein